MGQSFLNLMPVDEALGIFEQFHAVSRLEKVPLGKSVGRVTAKAIQSPESIPPFSRALMDGYAVRASDVASARETSPVFLEVTGAVTMGSEARLVPGSGQAVSIPTGAMLPEACDTVVMVEHTRELPDGRIEVLKASAPGQHVLKEGDDFPKGQTLLGPGHRICELDLGALAACGVSEIEVVAKPRVAILSTGDELVGLEDTPSAGQVRDTNATTLAAQVERCGVQASIVGRVEDEYKKLLDATSRACSEADMVLLSGGSSVGARDHTANVLKELSGKELLIEGVAISPGKPTLLAKVRKVAVFGLPGHPVSSFVVTHALVSRLIKILSGDKSTAVASFVKGRLEYNARAAPGRETWMRVLVEKGEDGENKVFPIHGESAVYSSLLQCNGLLRIPADREGFAKGEVVSVEVLR